MNYSTVPFKNFYCTQNYNQAPTHYKQSQSTNGVKAYPIDIIDDIYCGCDEMVVIKINGVGTKTVNQIFVQSVNPVKMPIGEYYITYLITHPNDTDIKKNLYVGKKFKRNEFIIHKGTDGGVGAHIDLVIAKSKQSGWTKSSYNEYILPDSIKPEEGMYLDNNFTKITNNNSISFTNKPNLVPVGIDDSINQVKVICDKNTLYIRNYPSLDGKILGFAIPGVYNILDIIENNNYKWYKVEENIWFANAKNCTIELPFYSMDQLPVGSVLKIIGDNIPRNYLKCDGSIYDTKKYKVLFKILNTDKLPNMSINYYIKSENIVKI